MTWRACFDDAMLEVLDLIAELDDRFDPETSPVIRWVDNCIALEWCGFYIFDDDGSAQVRVKLVQAAGEELHCPSGPSRYDVDLQNRNIDPLEWHMHGRCVPRKVFDRLLLYDDDAAAQAVVELASSTMDGIWRLIRQLTTEDREAAWAEAFATVDAIFREVA